MITDLKALKQNLQDNDYTCVISFGDEYYTSVERGVKPLLALIDDGICASGAYAADKVVGKAAAFMYVKLGISAIYALVISKPALSVLRSAGITVIYDELVEAIKNRRGDGFCPMESAVVEVSDIDEAIFRVRDTLAKMMRSENS